MKAVDTNVVLRFFLNDDPDQAAVATGIFRGPLFIPLTVLMETAWVLAFSYGRKRADIAEALSGLLDLPTVVVESEPAVRWALDRYARHGADLSDLLHLVGARTSSRFATFDRKLAGQAGPDAPVPVETVSA